MRSAPSSRMTSPFSIGFSTMWAARSPYSSGRPSRAGCGTCAPSAAREWFAAAEDAGRGDEDYSAVLATIAR